MLESRGEEKEQQMNEGVDVVDVVDVRLARG